MTDTDTPRESIRVAVIGGGPAGLAAATRLRQRGIEQVVVLERESEAGGIPRHCGHPPFGMREFRRCLNGPGYAARLRREALDNGVDIRTGITVTACGTAGQLTVTTSDGLREIKAERVVLATGVRETPRSTRLVSGPRPLGVLSTGALQALVYLKGLAPFHRPLIVGTELVAFSALLTCRHAGIEPVAMVDEGTRITARAFCRGLPMLLGVPVLLSTRIAAIEGKSRVTGALLQCDHGSERRIECDGVLFTGQFTPESTLVRMSHLELDAASGGPLVDSHGRCTDPAYYAAGNLLRPVETAGWCWQEGRNVGDAVADDLLGRLDIAARPIDLDVAGSTIRFVTPRRLHRSNSTTLPPQLRFSRRVRGRLAVLQDGRTLWSRSLAAVPERRVLLPSHAFTGATAGRPVTIAFETEA